MTGWIIVLTFVFAAHIGAKVEVIRCRDLAALDALEPLAYADPAVTRVQVFAPGTYTPSPVSGLSMRPPVIDDWQG